VNQWQAKYEALKAAIEHQEYIDHAEHLVETALKVSSTRPITFEQAIRSLLSVVASIRDDNEALQLSGRRKARAEERKKIEANLESLIANKSAWIDTLNSDWPIRAYRDQVAGMREALAAIREEA